MKSRRKFPTPWITPDSRAIYRMAKLLKLFGFSAEKKVGVNINYEYIIQWHDGEEYES